VVIRSPNELDVVAVYTAERPDQPAIQLEIETLRRESFKPTTKCVHSASWPPISRRRPAQETVK
jgi:hypothetical protein